MPDLMINLVNALNLYDGSIERTNELRDMICDLSENITDEDRQRYGPLLYLASQRMRVFGYNYVSKFFPENYEKEFGIMSVCQDNLLLELYRSKSDATKILDNYQLDTIYSFEHEYNRRLMIGAPTSFGKTFIAHELIARNYQRYNNIIMIFPTNALLFENMERISILNKQLGWEYTIHNVVKDQEPVGRNVFIYTPERALQFLAKYPTHTIDFFFFDEVYKIDNTISGSSDERYNKSTPVIGVNRSLIFRICLYVLSKNIKECYLAGPFISKSSLKRSVLDFLEKCNISFKEITFEPTVKRKLEIISKPPKYKQLAEILTKELSGQTLIYCASPGRVSKYSINLKKVYDGNVPNSKVEDLINHLKNRYELKDETDDEWSVVKMLKTNIGVHHGKMPPYVQKEMLHLFIEEQFDIMFCTSTIIEGVNTNAHNVILMDGTISTTPLSPFDLKNIIGRCGRYYHNFIGHYIFVDEKIKNIDNGEISLEYVSFSQNDLSQNIIDLDNMAPEDLHPNNIDLKRKRMETNFDVPWDIAVKNRTILRETQDKLFNVFTSQTNKLLDSDTIKTALFKPDNFDKTIIKILGDYCKANLLDQKNAIRMHSIASNYNKKGIKGLIRYYYSKRNNIEKAINDAFNALRTTLSFEIPLLLNLYETLHNYYLQSTGVADEELKNYSLAPLISFFETGVKTDFGKMLSDSGFPLDTIKQIENKFHNELRSLPEQQYSTFVSDNRETIESLLDNLEKRLFDQAIRRYMAND